MNQHEAQRLIPKYDWEFNTVGIYNYRKPGPHDSYINYIRLNHSFMDGDIVEAGVYRGKTLLATALLLKELGSSKKVYGFDSFHGFPPIYDAKDDIASFKILHAKRKISDAHYEAVKRNLEIKQRLGNAAPNASNISTSGDFSHTSRQLVEAKIKLLGLDNIVLVEGVFSETMSSELGPSTIFAAMIDCDLYQSHWHAFEFIWPRLNNGGLIQLDEYYSLKFPGARWACDEFLGLRGKHRLIKIEPDGHDQFERWAVIKL